MFDIDGTLTETFQVDEECFVEALQAVFGFAAVNTDWSSYQHTSDSGIIHELFHVRRGRAPERSELAAFQAQFLSLLSAAEFASPQAFRAVAGAEGIVQRLANGSGHAVALATGGWKISACFKLSKAGLKLESLPAAFADDALAREEIMQISLKRASVRCGRDTFDTITYVGDGVWDLRAANNLGFRFIGVGCGESARKLRSAGASFVFPEYLDTNAFASALEELFLKPVRRCTSREKVVSSRRCKT
ncbi:MAG: HAD family hydrolase [Verrucomicrobia bacterium]|nr:MAG: HAD family hydrolase [Verrucomicrobiota bacterium]